MRNVILAVATTLLVSACGPSFKMTPPEAFSRFEKGSDFKFITADGVRLKAREVDNYPKATLPFWSDALARHLKRRGYVSKSQRCFKTRRGMPGCTLDFVLPRGDEDWVMSETIFVVGDKVVLVEVAGPYARFAQLEKHLQAALSTFEP